MNMLVSRRFRVVPERATLVNRALQGNGEILVKRGQEVIPSDVIGRSVLSAGFRTINLSKALQVSPGEVKKYLQRSMGKAIYKGELLGFNGGGLFGSKRVVTSPTDGILELFNEETGILKLKILPHNIDLPAAVFGIVDGVDHVKKIVSIKTQVTEVYGILGSGRPREGYLKVLGERGDLIDKNKISYDLHDKIIVGGGLIYDSALKEAVTFGVNGIITGGISSSEFKGMSGGKIKYAHSESEVGIGVLVTEGFGTIPVGQDIFDLLKSFDNKFVILEGNEGKVSLPSTNPGSIKSISKVQLSSENLDFKLQTETIETGKIIRVVGNPYMGEQGKVVAIDNAITILPTGVKVYMITILTNSRKIRVPYSNVEIIF